MSYDELDRASNRLANSLIARGVTEGCRVGLFLHKGFELAIGIYGILKAGCVFVPLDPFTPADRLSFILSDCQINHLVSTDALSEPLEALDDERQLVLYGVESATSFDRLTWAQIDQFPETLPELLMIDQELGYIMYTSGSTGVPKGMMHSHLGSITYARWGAMHVGLMPADRVASHAPLHFDLSIFDFFSTVQAGATVVLVPEAVTRMAASWTKMIEDEKISVVFTVPFTLISMLEHGAMGKRDLSSLRWIMFGGEPFPPRQLKQMMAALPDVQFTNVYGPAEAPSCTCYDIPRPLTLDDDEMLPIGLVSKNSEDLIVDGDGGECGIGEPGELCIRSTTLTRGYWNRPDLNEKAYLYRDGQGPFSNVYFRTGDRVERYSDGLLRFLGRMDRMVKTRGHRVELDEVEATLTSYESVLEAAAFIVPDDHGTQTILAAVKPQQNVSLQKQDILKMVRSKLPPYAVPRDLLVLDQFPHTSTGKIDRRKLAELFTTTD